MNGILLLDKPSGLSSNAALQRVRRLMGAAKAGHVAIYRDHVAAVLKLAGLSDPQGRAGRVVALETALASWETRVQTGRLNAWLTALIAATPPPVRGGKQPKIMFATQAGIRPPHFVLFTSGFLQAGYRRFIERRLREEFGFDGSPVHVTMRLREKRQGAGGRPAGGARRS